MDWVSFIFGTLTMFPICGVIIVSTLRMADEKLKRAQRLYDDAERWLDRDEIGRQAMHDKEPE